MPIAKTPPHPPITLTVFPSDLGWMAMLAAGATVQRLTFGHLSPAAAKKALGPKTPQRTIRGKRNTALVRRLQAYVSGKSDDFRDVEIDPGPISRFRRRVFNQCRKIPVGQTVGYAELAAKAGFPRAARAVGHCMASNRIPLIIPCHRVVRSDGGPGSYSAPGGVRMKRRLLALEAEELA